MSGVMMFMGVGSNAGKTVFTRSLCRWLSNQGRKVTPFKAVTVGKKFEEREGLTLDFRMWILAAAARAAGTIDQAPIQVIHSSGTQGRLTIDQQEAGTVQLYAQDTVLLHHLPGPVVSGVCAAIAASLERLRASYDVVVIEGAGNAVDLGDDDIANVHVARLTKAPIVLVASISAGGALAALASTIARLPADIRRQVVGFVINDVLGGSDIAAGQARELARECGVTYLGALPHCTFYDQIPTGQHSSLPDDEAEYEMLAQMLAANVDVAVLRDWIDVPEEIGM